MSLLLLSFDYKSHMKLLSFVTEFGLQYLKSLISRAVTSIDFIYAGLFNSVGKSSDFFIRGFVKMKTAYEGIYLFIREALLHLCDNRIGTAVTAGVENNESAVSIDYKALLVGEIIGSELSVFFYAKTVFFPSLFKALCFVGDYSYTVCDDLITFDIFNPVFIGVHYTPFDTDVF